MGDTLVLFGKEIDTNIGSQCLSHRPGMTFRTPVVNSYKWGSFIEQQSSGDRYRSVSFGHTSIHVTGRPTVRSSGLEISKVALESIAEWVRFVLDGRVLFEGASDLTKHLSGMYCIWMISEDRVELLTDHMGFRPVYAAKNSYGQLLGLGTHVESLASSLGIEDRFDLVSLAELFTHNYVTFPYTTREDVQELEPCTAYCWECDQSGEIVQKSETLWEPIEPSCYPDAQTVRKDLQSALVTAGEEITQGCSEVGVLLSGGVDSRAVLGVVPSDRVKSALTYVTRENNETRVAQLVAKEHGVQHAFVQRDESYFPNMIERGLALLGTELRGNCHGLCIADQGCADEFDVIVGGQLSDTFLKFHFMPMDQRARYQPTTLRSRLKRFIKGVDAVPKPSKEHTTGRDQLIQELTPEYQQQVRLRRQKRLKEVERVRPTTAVEWQRFWPCSRQDDSAHTLGNARLMCSDTLFAHQAIVEVAVRFDPKLRVGGVFTDEVFQLVAPELMKLVNANTGLPADAPASKVRAKRKKDRKAKQTHCVDKGLASDWNNVETSWVNPVLMQKHSAQWKKYRESLKHSPAMDVLSKFIARGGEVAISEYQEDLPSTSNHMVMQLAIRIDQVLQARLTEERTKREVIS